MLTLFVLVNASLVRLRYAADAPEPEFKAPFNVGRLPLTAVGGGLAAIALIVFSFTRAV